MTGFLLQRLLATIPVMAVVAVVVFLLLHLGPGDPAAVIAGDYATPEDIERIRDRLGLNEPLHVQFLTWIGQVLTGDLGISIFSNLPVAQLIAQRVEPTLALSIGTLI
ncbi:MAG: ABC transporter permease, partial [Rhodospirillales bacterium]|nr:ABC transporter permease [Rhodospirillales bacterium]